MSHVSFEDVAAAVQVQSGAVVSKVIHRDEAIEVTVFGFDADEGLSEHTATRSAIVQVLSGRLSFTVEGDGLEMLRGAWLHMDAGATHSLTASEPTVMLLTLLPS